LLFQLKIAFVFSDAPKKSANEENFRPNKGKEIDFLERTERHVAQRGRIGEALRRERADDEPGTVCNQFATSGLAKSLVQHIDLTTTLKDAPDFLQTVEGVNGAREQEQRVVGQHDDLTPTDERVSDESRLAKDWTGVDVRLDNEVGQNARGENVRADSGEEKHAVKECILVANGVERDCAILATVALRRASLMNEAVPCTAMAPSSVNSTTLLPR
jgi:hypothetical protein